MFKYKGIVMALAAVALASGSVRASEVSAKAGGFVDAQFNMSNAGTTNGFSVNDGALYLTAETGTTSVNIDLPFFSDAFGSGDNSFTFATTKAQAFFMKKYDTGGCWKLGQFDTIFGFEANDSPDIQYSHQGLIFANILPLTHTGLHYMHTFGKELTLNLIVANKFNHGHADGLDMDYGAQLVFKNDSFHLFGGVLLGKDHASSNMNSLIDVLAGVTQGSLTLDAELDLTKSAAAPDTGLGILANVAYNVNKDVGLGVRGEFLSKVTDTLNVARFQQIGVTAGPQFTLSSAAKAKVDYSLVSTTLVDGGASVTSHAAALSVVYKI
jgi:hypothetical protein